MRPVSAPTSAESFRERLATVPWRVLHTPSASGAWNMNLDELLLAAAAREEGPPTLRLYTWDPPCVSVGRFQSLEGIDLDYARGRGWDLVRRPTGGRAVLHNRELTYSLIAPPSSVGDAGVRTSYSVLVGALNAGLRRLLGAEADTAVSTACDARSLRTPNCFAISSECDSVAPGGKLVGSAQVRKSGALLQHGSILLDAEPRDWQALFGDSGRMVTLRQLLGRVPGAREVADAVMSGFTGIGALLEERALTQTEALGAKASRHDL